MTEWEQATLSQNPAFIPCDEDISSTILYSVVSASHHLFKRGDVLKLIGDHKAFTPWFVSSDGSEAHCSWHRLKIFIRG